MKRREFLELALTGMVTGACRSAGEPAAAKRLLVLSETTAFRHSSIPVAREAVRSLGLASGAWEVVREADTASQVASAVTAEALAQVDGVVFANTTGTLSFSPAGREAFYEWIALGGSFIGIHSAADTFHDDPDYIELLRGEFLTHGPQTTVEIFVQDPTHPACLDLPSSFQYYDEIYEFKNWSRSNVHVLLAMHQHPQTGEPGDFPIAWTSRYGRGRVFYCALGHGEQVYADDLYRRHLTGGILWSLGLEPGDDARGNPIR
jgi:hypothetical protein